MTWVRAAVLVVALAGAAQAHGEDCSRLADRAARLECFDRGAQGAAPAAAPRSAVQSSGRCQATTKKGAQCKRNAKPGSSYCWQHGK
jgi:hypothetical protein